MKSEGQSSLEARFKSAMKSGPKRKSDRDEHVSVGFASGFTQSEKMGQIGTVQESVSTISDKSEIASPKSLKFDGSIAPSRIESKTEYDGISTVMEMQMVGSAKFDKMLKQKREWEIEQLDK